MNLDMVITHHHGHHCSCYY